MKLNYTDGCICTSLTVDYTETINMDPEELRKVVHKLIDTTDDISVFQRVFMDILELNGKVTELGRCEECGDWVRSYDLEI